MKSVSAVIKLIRWPNLLFIFLTQLLFWYFVIPFAFLVSHSGYETTKLTGNLFFLLTLASVLIASAGYIINDYFDVDIDQVNKSSKVIIGTLIKKRSAILLHAFLSAAGLMLSIYVGIRLNNYYIIFFNFLSIVLLWLYSTTFKKKLLIGNVLISLLTAWVILVLALAEYRFRISATDIVWQRILKVSFLYAGFAFIISLVREVIKDMEDIEGDSRFDCTTMPIVWGIQAAKVFAGVWLVVLVLLILAILIYILQFGWWYVSLYSVVTIVAPSLWLLRKLADANTSADYHQLSKSIKLIMLAGILSMIFFW
ncbi:MAG: geranylgeranylglycerol-phosphate geranylgeranyltransferase [Ginsengibacter sp.]